MRPIRGDIVEIGPERGPTTRGASSRRTGLAGARRRRRATVARRRRHHAGVRARDTWGGCHADNRALLDRRALERKLAHGCATLTPAASNWRSIPATVAERAPPSPQNRHFETSSERQIRLITKGLQGRPGGAYE
jgi:hypothetical protein